MQTGMKRNLSACTEAQLQACEHENQEESIVGHLYKFNLLQMVRRRSEMFWTLLFPLLLSTLFYVTFGTGAEVTEQMQSIPVGLVIEGQGNTYFETFLQGLDGSAIAEQTDSGTIDLRLLEAGEARAALESGTVEGVFYSKEEPTLTVTGSQISESILEALLNAYLQNQKLMREILEENPEQLMNAVEQMAHFQERIEPVSAGGKTTNDSLTYFFALIGMACLFGAFQGMTSASNLRADQSALAARRSITPRHRFSMVVSEMLAAFTIQFLNCCLLLIWIRFVLGVSIGDHLIMILPVCALGSMVGVAMGIFIGCMRVQEGIKLGILIGGSLFFSFLSGLMFGNMKDLVEHHAPILNRINPSALIADAFYCISVYDNPARYGMNLTLLAVITAILVFAGYWRLRRERYDSI